MCGVMHQFERALSVTFQVRGSPQMRPGILVSSTPYRSVMLRESPTVPWPRDPMRALEEQLMAVGQPRSASESAALRAEQTELVMSLAVVQLAVCGTNPRTVAVPFARQLRRALPSWLLGHVLGALRGLLAPRHAVTDVASAAELSPTFLRRRGWEHELSPPRPDDPEHLLTTCPSRAPSALARPHLTEARAA